MHRMNWDDLRFVLALARARTLSGAALELATTHTTVARRIRGLEENLGSRLFERDDEGYVLTLAGQQVHEVGQRLESELLALEARVLGRDVKLEGKLRVTTMDILFRRYGRVFASFVREFPGIELTLTCSDNEASLPRREADVALRLAARPPEHLVGRKVGRVDFAVYAERRLARRVGRDAPWSAFPWIHWDERLMASWLDAWLGEHAPGARIGVRVDVPSLALREVVAAGMGLHFLATSEGDGDPRLSRVGPVQTAHGRDVWLLTLAELRTNSRVRAFMDHFAAHAHEASPLSSAKARSSPSRRMRAPRSASGNR